MNRALAPLLLLSLPLLAGNVRVDLPGGSGGTDLVLSYDNGTPNWLTWDGTYRGTWFNLDDFMPGGTSFNLGSVEYWFYEHALTDPWDTDQFYSEVWNGDQTGPQVLLAQDVVTAFHYAPCYHEAYVVTGQHFWCLVNTEMSSGGWPSILADGVYKGLPDHSYFSDDFIFWEPWSGDPDFGDFFIRAYQANALDATTWGSLKALF